MAANVQPLWITTVDTAPSAGVTTGLKFASVTGAPPVPFRCVIRRPGTYPTPTTAEVVTVTTLSGTSVTAGTRDFLSQGGITIQAGYEVYQYMGDFLHRSYTHRFVDDPSDRSTIQDAIDDVNARGGGVVELPAGTFTLDDTTSLTLKDGVVLKGQGKGITELKAPVTSGTYYMMITPAWGDASGTSTSLTANGVMGAKTITVTSTTGFSANDFALMYTTSSLVVQTVRIKSVNSATSLTLHEPLYDTFNTAKSPVIRRLVGMVQHIGVKDMTLNGVNATGSCFGLSPWGFYDSEFDFETKDWAGASNGCGFLPFEGYRSTINGKDSRSGSGAYANYHMFYLSNCTINYESHGGGVALRIDACHGNNFPSVRATGYGSRGLKLAYSCHNAFGVVHNDGAILTGGNGRGLVFAYASHHNTIGAVHSSDNAEIDIWFDGVAADNVESAFSDDYNMIGSVVISGSAVNRNIYVGAVSVGNHIAAVTNITIDDQSNGLGLTIGTAPPKWVDSTEMIIRTGTPVNTFQGAASSLYKGWAMATTEEVMFSWRVPKTYSATRIKFALEWTNLGAGAGNVTWVVFSSSNVEGNDIDAAGIAFQVQTLAAAARDVRKRTVHSTAILTVTPGALVNVIIQRSPTNDTLGNDVGLIGVEIIPA